MKKYYSSVESQWKSYLIAILFNLNQQQVVNDVIKQQLEEEEEQIYLGIIANWLITRWNTIPFNHFHQGMAFQSRGDFRHFSHRHHHHHHFSVVLLKRAKWWNNVIMWLNWWLDKRLYKLITDCDVIGKLWYFLCYISLAEISFSPSTPNTMKTSAKTLFHKQTRDERAKPNIFSTPFSHKIYIYSCGLEERGNNKQKAEGRRKKLFLPRKSEWSWEKCCLNRFPCIFYYTVDGFF